MEIILDDLSGHEIQELLRTHMNIMLSQTPIESVHALPLDGLKAANVNLWSAWENGQIFGCGALKTINNAHGEIKSMHVYKQYRGRGIGNIILNHIVEIAKARGLKRLSLETGSSEHFIAARNMYKNFGFTECGPFEGYEPDPNSCFMTMEIA